VHGVPGALVLTHIAGYGTGTLRHTTSWYRLAQGQLVPMLSFPHYFHVAGWAMPLSRVLTTTPIEIPAMLAPGAVLRLRFEVKYAIYDSGHSDEDELFALEDNLDLQWSEDVQMFVPKTGADDFARIEDYWNQSTEQFVDRNRPHLQRLLQTGNNRQRQFVMDHLLQ
jgi:hypothetical protein